MRKLLYCLFAAMLMVGFNGCNRTPAGDAGVDKPMAPAGSAPAADPAQKGFMQAPPM